MDTHTTMLCEMKGLSGRMLATEIVPFGAAGTAYEESVSMGRMDRLCHRSFAVPVHRVQSVRMRLRLDNGGE
jgi:hypothetical protein